MQTQNKQKEVFLTQAQFDARQTAGTLEQGVIYHITGSIPKSDLASSVQSSLDKADTALQASDITGKEDVDNKVTTLSSASTDTQYPSAKAIVDYAQPKVPIVKLC